MTLPDLSAAIVHRQDERTAIICHDARSLPVGDGTVDLIVTSPPYWGHRDYDIPVTDQIGIELDIPRYLDALDECMLEWKRILKPTGSVWVNINDKYHRRSLLGIPWRFAHRQIDQGWFLRAEVIWRKHGMPEAVDDRVRRDHEYLFHFTRQSKYYADLKTIREPDKGTKGKTAAERRAEDEVAYRIENRSRKGLAMHPKTIPSMAPHPDGRIPGSVWEIPVEPLRVPKILEMEHPAPFPAELPRRIIEGWSPPEGLVLDPFGGTGTVAGVARVLNRFGISNDLSESYNRLAEWRIWTARFDRAEDGSWADRQLGFE